MRQYIPYNKKYIVLARVSFRDMHAHENHDYFMWNLFNIKLRTIGSFQPETGDRALLKHPPNSLYNFMMNFGSRMIQGEFLG